MKTLNIDVTKIDKTAIHEGKKGKYLALTLHDRPDEWGNAGFVTQDLGQERRKAGERGPILGNWKNLATPAAAPKTATQPKQGDDFDNCSDIPF